MVGELTVEVSRMLNESFMTDIRSKFGFSIPKEILRPLIQRADNAVMIALGDSDLGDLPESLIYSQVDLYEQELELFITDVALITDLAEERVREKINAAVENVCDKLYDYIRTWLRVKHANDAHARSLPQQKPRKNQHDSRQARNHRNQHFTR